MIRTEANCIKLARLTLTQHQSIEWKHARRLIITASMAYTFFTYCSNKKPNWDIDFFISTNFERTRSMQYGINTEAKAIATSPDGIAFMDNDEAVLLEVKCPVFGENHTKDELKYKLLNERSSYLKEDSGCLTLKRKHKYYGQMQLSMYILNIQNGLLIIYANVPPRGDNGEFGDFLEVKVPKDDLFINEMISVMHESYYSNVLPRLEAKVCTNKLICV